MFIGKIDSFSGVQNNIKSLTCYPDHISNYIKHHRIILWWITLGVICNLYILNYVIIYCFSFSDLWTESHSGKKKRRSDLSSSDRRRKPVTVTDILYCLIKLLHYQILSFPVMTWLTWLVTDIKVMGLKPAQFI